MSQFPAVALGDAGIVAVAIILAVYEGWLYSRRRGQREHLWLALICVSAAVHAGLLVFHHGATPEGAVPLLKGELAALIVMAHCVPFLVQEISGQKMRVPAWAWLASAAFWLALVPTALIIPDQVEFRDYFLLDRPFPRRVDTPMSVVGIAYAFGLVGYCTVWLNRRQKGRERQVRHFTFGVVAWAAFGVQASVFGGLGWPMPMSTFEYGFFLFALALVSSDARNYMAMLSASERDFENLIERSPECVAIVVDGELRKVNRAFVKTLGYSRRDELEGTAVAAIVTPDDKTLVADLLAEGVSAPVTSARFLRHSGDVVELELVLSSLEVGGTRALVLLARDVTERKQLTAQLMEMDRVISMGTLAAGIGHELNNPLSYVLLNLDEAKRHVSRAAQRHPELDDAVDCIEASLDGAQRIRDVASGLALFSRLREEASVLDLKDVVRTAASIAHNQLSLRARLELNVAPGLRVHGDDSRLVQVFVNLLVNAAQAIPEGDVDAHRVSVTAEASDDGWIVCEVRDTGAGMSADVVERVFEPFFTTKKRGVGTGLGLSICKDCVERMGGRLSARSTPGKGSTFRVELPAAEGEPAAPPRPVSGPPPGQLRVLLVDDEVLLLRSFKRALSRDFEVEVAASVDEATALIESGQRLDFVVSDLMMPGRSGMDLYDWVRERDPALAERFVFMSGGTYTPEARAFQARISNPCLAKPVDAAALWKVFREMSGQSPVAARTEH